MWRPGALNCDEAGARLEGGQDVPRSEPELQHHLDTCPRCREHAAAMRSEDERLTVALRVIGPDEASFARIKAGWRVRLNERRRGRLRPVPRTRMSLQKRALAAAAILLGITALFFIAQGSPFRDVPQTSQKVEPVTPPLAGNSNPAWTTLSLEPVTSVADLQARLRELHLLDDLSQVEVIMRSLKDAEGVELTQDATLYLERLFALNPGESDLCRDILNGIQASHVSERLAVLRERWRAPDVARVGRTLETTCWALGPALQPILATMQPSGGETGTFSEAERVFHAHQYDKALDLYRTFAERRPQDRRAPLAEHASAFILQKKLKAPAEARKTYQRIAKGHATDFIGQTACFHIAETFEDDGLENHALEQYGKFLDLAPRHPRAKEADRRAEALRRKEMGEEPQETWGQILIEKNKSR